MSQDDSSLAARAEQVLQDSWEERKAGKTFSVTGVHVITALAFLSAAVALAVLAPHQRDFSPMLALGLALAYALGGRVLIAVGAGYAVPTQLALVPMLVVLPPAVVPLVVAGGLVLAAGLDEWLAKRRVAWIPLVVAIGDAPYALAPAGVFVLLGAPTEGLALVLACVIAAPAQCAADYLSSAAREWAIRGLLPRQQLAVMAQVWGVDLMLWPIGVVVAESILRSPWATFTLVPVLLLLDRLVRERNTRLDQAQERLRELDDQAQRLEQAVRRIGQAFGQGHDLDAVMTTTLQTVADSTGAHSGRLTIYRPDETPRTVEVPVTTDDASAVTEERPPDVTLRVVGGDGVAADLELARPGGALSDEQNALVRYLIEHALRAEQHIDRHRRLYDEAQTDELTGLANFRRLHRALDEGEETYARHGQPTSLILLDLDRFKSVNDTYGHQAGDIVLQTVAFALRDTARLADLAARYGGEELALVLPNTGPGGALAVAERLASAIRGRTIPLSGTDTLSVTASFGVATLGVHAETKTDLVRAADDALYAAKAGGRDRVNLADVTPQLGVR